LYLTESEKTVSEGAGAAAVAAVMTNKVANIQGKNVAVVVSGGNIDVNVMAQVIECGLVDSGRRVKFQVLLNDRPGSLSELMKTVSSAQANVVAVHHERTLGPSSLGFARVLLTLDVRYDNVVNFLSFSCDVLNQTQTIPRFLFRRGKEQADELLATLNATYKDAKDITFS
jgi:threonine dehydratase